jgi:hypothetical protein
MNFMTLKMAINNKFDELQKGNLYISNATKEELWDTYISSFRPEDNQLLRVRTEHDCNCCKSFIRTAGGILAIVNNKIVSIWDVVDVPEGYQIVADAMAALVKSKGIYTEFLHYENTVGTDHNHDTKTNVVWDHFYLKLPSKFVNKDSGAVTGLTRDRYNMARRSLTGITMESINIVIQLIKDKEIYRGEEHLDSINKFAGTKNAFESISEANVEARTAFLWEASKRIGAASGFRTTVIGTLLSDISEGVELYKAVKSFESKVAPSNYKRPTPILSKAAIEKAEAKIIELGIAASLERRMSRAEDITINNVLFADRSAQEKMGIFHMLQSEVKVKVPSHKKDMEMSIDDFINDVLPKVSKVEMAMDNTHVGNLMTLVSPIYEEAESILKWGNNFSWSYNGEVTDSIKERVKAAGGNVTGDVRASLSWHNADDLDLHIKTPNGRTINFSTRTDGRGGELDVDMNANGKHDRINPVENVTWQDESRMVDGPYQIDVNNYTKRQNDNIGFELELEHKGIIRKFVYDKAVRQGETINVVKFGFTAQNGINITKSLPSVNSQKIVWGVCTNKFQKVSMIMNSPNHWDGEATGNKHVFFMLEGCVNPEPVRGFYNEFLRDDLHSERKVFEVLAGKMKPEPSVNQLSGLGFSSTQRNSVLCKVTGEINRTIKIKF